MSTQDPQWTSPSQGYPPPGAPYPPYAQPPAPYAQYVQPQPRAVKNPLATRALIYGIISFVLFVAIFFTNYIVLATFGLYAIYYAIRGLIFATKLPGHKGIIPSIFGLLLSVLSVLGTIGVIALNAMLASGH